MNNKMATMDGLISLPKSNTTKSNAGSSAAGAKRKIGDVTNNNKTVGYAGLRRTPVKTTPYVAAPSTRPPRWNDAEVSFCGLLLIGWL